MKQSKSFASLTPTLLARKGTAKPAMRPQLGAIGAAACALEHDLGFNDMGPEADNDAAADMPLAQAEVVALTPAKAAKRKDLAAQSELHRMHNAVAGRIGARRAPRRSALAEGRLAAFTLRLDADRHLELRLASALAGRSAQHLLTEALDRMIEGLPEVADLAARAGKRK